MTAATIRQTPLGAIGGCTLVALVAVPTGAARQARELTGFGATRSAWAARHVADPNPRLNRGCCFLPKQSDGTDRYYNVEYDNGRVVSYEMDFAPRVSEAVARVLMRQEVPADARIVAQARKPTCEQIEYSSVTLKRTLGYAKVGVEFSATGVGGPYRGVVGDVLIGQFYSVKLGC